MRTSATECLIFEAHGSKLTIHPYPSIRNNKRYDIALLQSLLSEAFGKVSALLDVGEVDGILFESESYAIIEEYGFGAVTENQEALVLTLSPDKSDLSESLKKYYCALIAHELHHAVRFQKYPYRRGGFTLYESIIFEGLGEVFQEELYPDAPLHINPEVTGLVDWIKRVKNEDTKYDYNAWFYGTGDIPRWAGYTIGYQIVKRTLINKKITAADAVWMNPEEFIS